MKHLSIVALVVALIAIAGEAFILTRQTGNSDEEYRQAIRNEYRVFAPVLPDTLMLADERVPMEIFYVREGLDRELSSIMYQQVNTQLIMKRSARFFPMIEEILKKNGVPEDMKYLCVTESMLTNARSPAKAQGFWQFLEGTAKQFGLEVNSEVDMRNDVEAATEAACAYLNQLYQQFGSWSMAAAAYNRGHNGLARQIEEQSTNVYYDMYLNSETSRYVYRILAYKLILQHPQDYGFTLRHCDLYPPIPYKTVTLSEKNVDLFEFARRNNCSYKMLRILNPWIVADMLHNREGKTYTIKLPVTNGTQMAVITEGRKDTSLVERI